MVLRVRSTPTRIPTNIFIPRCTTHPGNLHVPFRKIVPFKLPLAPRIWYSSLFTKPRCRHQPSRANSKICYKVGNWHASPPLQREATAPFGYWSELVFPSSCSTRPKRAPLQGFRLYSSFCQCFQETVGQKSFPISPLTEQLSSLYVTKLWFVCSEYTWTMHALHFRLHSLKRLSE